MIFLYIKLIHLLSMAFWLSSIVKEVSVPIIFNNDMKNNKVLNNKREKIVGSISTISGMGTILRGIVLIYMTGYGNVPLVIYIAFGLTIVMASIGAFGVGGTFDNITKALDSGTNILELELLSKKLRDYSKILLVLWIVVFLLMGLRHII